MSQTDDQLITKAQAGDREAFHQLVDLYAPRLYQLAAIMTGNFNDAQDLVQETLLAAYQALPGFERRATVKTWLTGIMMRQASLARRKKARHKMTSLDNQTDSQHPIDRSVSVARNTQQADARIDLMSLMQGLTVEHREVLTLREIQGLTYEEIAQIIGQPRGTVESRLFRARQSLKQLAQQSLTRTAEDNTRQTSRRSTTGGDA